MLHCKSFFRIIEPVYNEQVAIQLGFTTSEIGQTNNYLVNIFILVKTLTLSSGVEAQALIRMFGFWNIPALHIFWVMNFIALAMIFECVLSVSILYLLLGCHCILIRGRVISEKASQMNVNCNLIEVIRCYNTTLFDIQEFNHLTKYLLFLIDLCIVPLIGLIISICISGKINVYMRFVCQLGICLISIVFLALYFMVAKVNHHVKKTSKNNKLTFHQSFDQ